MDFTKLYLGMKLRQFPAVKAGLVMSNVLLPPLLAQSVLVPPSLVVIRMVVVMILGGRDMVWQSLTWQSFYPVATMLSHHSMH